ncbi:MAG: hypothetical protein ACT4P6_15185 [Gemmatimonadaceae bacterium]
MDGDTVNGVTRGPVVIASGFVPNIDRTIETWGRPIELALRKRIRAVRLPAWVDIGLVAPTLRTIDTGISAGRSGPLERLQQSEAEWFERR